MAAELHHRHEAWTLAALEELPDDGYRYEIIDGQLYVTPPPTVGHQLLADAYCRLLRARGRDAVCAVGVSVPVELGRTESFVIPDVVILRRRGADQYVDPADVQMAVEVISRRTQRTDKVIKKDLARELQIETYVLVEPRLRWVKQYVLRGDDYVELAEEEHLITWDQVAAEAGL